MPYLIRSANGQRSLTKINSNKTQDQQDRTPLREDIVEALRGLVIKFELRIADIIEESTDEQFDDEKQKPDTVKATFAVKKDILSDLKTKLVINDQQVPKQEVEAEVDDALTSASVNQQNGIKKENGFDGIKPAVPDSSKIENGFAGFKPTVLDPSKKENGFAGFKPAVLDLPKKENGFAGFKPAVLDLPKTSSVGSRASSIRPILQPKSEPVVVQAPGPVIVSDPPILVRQDPKPVAYEPTRPVEEQPIEKIAAPSHSSVVNTPAIVESVEPKSVVSDAEPKVATAAKVPEIAIPKPKPAPPKTELVKGTLQIGSVIRTCVVGFAGTDEEPIYYIPYDTDEFITINQLLEHKGPIIDSQPMLNSINVGDIVFGKSNEDNNWYRTMVKKVNVDDVVVLFIDWGFEETLEHNRIRLLAMPELGLSSAPAAAVKIDVINKPGPLVDRLLRDQERLNVKVVSYDKTTDTYSIDIEDQQ